MSAPFVPSSQRTLPDFRTCMAWPNARKYPADVIAYVEQELPDKPIPWDWLERPPPAIHFAGQYKEDIHAKGRGWWND